MSTPQVIAFTRFCVDRHGLAEIARDLKLPADECQGLIARELERRTSDGTLVADLRKTIGHEIVETADRTCQDHGPYLAQRWRLRCKPKTPKWVGSMVSASEPFWGNCPQCDRLWQSEADAAALVVWGGLTAKQVAIATRLAAAEIPPRLQPCTFWNFQHGMPDQDAVFNWMRDFAYNAEIALRCGRSCALLGSTGTGKSHLAVAALAHFMEKGATGRYTTMVQLLSRVKGAYGERATESEAAALASFTKPDLLVIDEVGRNTNSSYDQGTFFRVLDERHVALKCTILVSNLGRQAFRDLMGEAAIDRLRDNGGKIIPLGWASYRGKKSPDES